VPIYTRTGDDGATFCAALGGRVAKDHPLIEFTGTLDKAVSALGLAGSLLAEEGEEALAGDVELLQRMLFALGSSLARGEPAPERAVEVLESLVDKYYPEELRYFILPGGTPAASALHLARALVREAERRLVSASRLYPHVVHGSLVRVLNRMSDALFAMAVYHARKRGKLKRVDLSWGFLE